MSGNKKSITVAFGLVAFDIVVGLACKSLLATQLLKLESVLLSAA